MATTIEKLINHLKQHGKDRTWRELTQLFNPKATDDWSRTQARQNGFNCKTGRYEIQNQLEEKQGQHERNKHAKDKDFLLKQILHLRKQIEVFKDLENYRPHIDHIPAPINARRGEATAIVQWSDWHLDESVKPQLVGGLNEYNETVAVKRCNTLFENTIKLTETQRTAVEVPNMVLQLGGDFITNYLHPENEQTNTMGPMQAVEFALDQICTGLHFLLKHGGFKNIAIVTNRGNHGRITDKMQFNNDYALNLETVIYCMVKKFMQNNKRLSFHISESAINYFDVYGKTLRFIHGHQVRYKGGIGGLTVPLYKAIHRWNETKKSYYTFFCDKHTYQNPTPDSQGNGSLVGYNAMALEFGFSYQPPLQSFTLLDSKRGITIKAPIFCI